MISSMKIIDGFAAALPAFADKKKYTFVKGVNLLYGRNGSGKSTLMHVLAGYCGLSTDRKRGGGWSKFPSVFYKDGPIQFPRDFKENTVGKTVAEVEWDGTPTFFNSSTHSDAGTLMSGSFFDSAADSPDGITDIAEQANLLMSPLSEGELRGYKLGKTFDAIKKFPKPITEVPQRTRPSEEAYINYVKSLPRTGPHTILLDEIDKSLGLDSQITFWTNIVPQFYQSGHQFIISTHSIIPIILKNENFNYIEMEDGFIDFIMKNLVERPTQCRKPTKSSKKKSKKS